MDKEHLKKLAEDPKFISAIYNYCDRWCERCSFTSRCMTFALSKRQFGDSQALDLNNEVVWQKLHEVLHVTLEMVKETAREQGIDLDSLDLKAVSAEQKNSDNIAENHGCARAAKAYAKMVQDWFDSAEQLLEQEADDLSLRVELELPGLGPAGQAASLKDAVEIIRWYQHFIYVKLLRAVRGTLEDSPPIFDELPKDSDGSAKIALIAMDRSIAAWGQMCEYFRDRDSGILDILVHLDRLRRKVEIVFPYARAFARPGFDKADGHGVRQ
jgi:hypothetical protein